jgi:hypothetical protein
MGEHAEQHVFVTQIRVTQPHPLGFRELPDLHCGG